MIYPLDKKTSYRFPGFHDPDDKRVIGLILAPSTWAASTVYEKRGDDDYDVVMPTVYTGFYYKVKNPGKSTNLEPTWVAVTGEETTQAGTSLVFEAVNYNMLPPAETVASVTYMCTHGVTVSNTSSTTKSCQFMIDPLPAAAIAAKVFNVTARIVKNNAEQVDASIDFYVKGN